ncbi:MAG: hypothetical protein OER96_08610 [Gammaproteobacteria bacterium]|nr:hypothetical protein [Gammaproteobacteria bacterium]
MNSSTHSRPASTRDTDHFLDFLERYWNITLTHVSEQMGALWDYQVAWRLDADIYLFGIINHFGRQTHLTIDQTLSLCVVFLTERMHMNLVEAQQTLHRIIRHVEARDTCAYLQAGEQALDAFTHGDFTSAHRLGDLLVADASAHSRPEKHVVPLT